MEADGQPFNAIRHAGRLRACVIEDTGTVQMAGGRVAVCTVRILATGERLVVNPEQVIVSLCERAE